MDNNDDVFSFHRNLLKWNPTVSNNDKNSIINDYHKFKNIICLLSKLRAYKIKYIELKVL